MSNAKCEYTLRDNFLGGFTRMVVSPGANGTIEARYSGGGGGNLQLTPKQWEDLLVVITAIDTVERGVT